MESGNPVSLAALLERKFQDIDAGAIASETGRLWRNYEEALVPILGGRGLAALFQRTLHKARGEHPWLADPSETFPAVVDLPALQAALARCDATEAAAGGRAFLQSFHDLLATLVGPSLTERLLRTAWAQPTGAEPAEDPVP